MADIVDLQCAAVLFDLDSVLVDSSHCVELVWREWGRRRDRNPEPFIRLAYGRRTSETLRLVAPELDVEREAAVLDRMEEECTEGLRAVPGALEIVRRIPFGRWGVVTSGHRPVATLRLTSVGIPVPTVLVTGDQVTRGKPDPEPYRIGLERLGFPAATTLVFEDAPPGIASAKGAGLRVVALRTTHADEALAAADFVVTDFRDVEVLTTDPAITLRLQHR